MRKLRSDGECEGGSPPPPCTVARMTAEPAGHAPGDEAAVTVPAAEYRRLRALERLASPQELESAEAAAMLEEYREWSAAGRPGAVAHAEARRLLLGETG
jgi:hypothetical protein